MLHSYWLVSDRVVAENRATKTGSAGAGPVDALLAAQSQVENEPLCGTLIAARGANVVLTICLSVSSGV